MKAIILAAGQGTRLRPLTNDRPKCMVEFKNKAIINYILEAFQKADVNNVHIVHGYKKEKLIHHLREKEVSFSYNPKFDTTNMVYSLFCAENELNDDIIISYADIIYREETIKKLLTSKAPISVTVDKDWKQLWELRMDNPLADAETLKLDQKFNILELGKKAKDYSEVQGQYMGLIYIKKEFIKDIRTFYHNLDKSALYDGKDFNNMYMTSFLQLIINQLSPIKAIPIHGGWVEIDSVEDLECYKDIVI